jgi:acetyl-CoA C-acetyltransferase
MDVSFPLNLHHFTKVFIMLKEIVLAGGVRTPIGGFCGTLAEVPAPMLGSIAIKAALKRANVQADQVSEVIFGNVLGAGLGQNVARQATIGAGLPPSVGATTVNKVCGSSLKAVMLAAQAIACGDSDVVIAGGAENMSSAPYLLPKARNGYRMGNGEIVDSMIRDGLWDVYNNVHMGTCGDRCAEKYSFSRQAQDDFAVASYQRAIEAQKQGFFASEIEPVEVKSRKDTVTVNSDEGPSRFNEEKLRALKAAFGSSGTITAGNASSINDGAAAIAVLSAEKAAELGVKPQARILGYATYSREPEWFTLAPVCAVGSLLEKLNLKADQVDLYEVNEAFAVVPMAVMKDLNVPHEKMNVRGGAVALGHPIGASGARVLVTLLDSLRQRQGKIGIASLCIGGGEAVALAVQAI